MYTITLLVQLLLLITFLWVAGTTLMGLLHPKKDKPGSGAYCSMAVVVCAHNEEAVVGKLLQSLAEQDYPRDKFHVFLLADHCSDRTAAVGRTFEQVTVYERSSGPRTGKGAVLTWGIPLILEKNPGRFTHMVIFDADNVADTGFLSALNQSFDRGGRLIMGNRLPLNPYDNIISEWYSMYWLTVDNLLCKPHHSMNLSAIISGTGFGFDLSLLEPEGWHTVTITEDMEFSMQQNFKGVFSDYQEEARFYDEQPTGFGTMIKQLRRWCTGNFEIAQHYRTVWFRHFRAKPDARLINNFVPMLMCTVFGFYFISNVFWLLYNAVSGLPLFAPKDVLWWIFLYLLSLGIGTYSAAKGGLSLTKMLPGILTSGLYCLLISLVAVYSLFKPQRAWIPIAHRHKDFPTDFPDSPN